MIGFSPWSVIKSRDQLVVGNTINYGYVTRKPVTYNLDSIRENEKKETSHLDSNHTHFVLVGTTLKLESLYHLTLKRFFCQVDNLKESKGFGDEINLRGEFERVVCANKTHEDLKLIWEELKKKELGRELELGWEGANGFSEMSEMIPREECRALCLCINGGLGTVKTVEASVVNRTPVLLIQGSGRASDLIADYLEAAQDEFICEQPSSNSQDARKRRIAKLIDDPNAGSWEKLLAEYDINVDNGVGSSVADLLRKIHATKLCIVCPLGAHLPKDGHPPMSLSEFISRALVLGAEATYAHENGKIDFRDLFKAMRGAEEAVVAAVSGDCAQALTAHVEPSVRSAGKTTPQPAKPGDLAAIKGIDRSVYIETELHLRRLAVVVERGQSSMLKQALDAIHFEHRGTLPKPLLNGLLQLALVHGQAGIASVVMHRGADLDWYDQTLRSVSESRSENTAPQKGGFGQDVWVELLRGASDEAEERYFAALLEKSWKSCDTPPSTPKVQRGQSKKFDKPNAKIQLGQSSGNLDISRSESASAQWAGAFLKDKSDAQAVRLLKNVYESIFKAVKVSECFSLCGGEWRGGDFALLLFSVLANRFGLAKLFFRRDAHRDAAAALPNALWASLLARRLTSKEMGQLSYRLRAGFEEADKWFADAAAAILNQTVRLSERCALRVLELPLGRISTTHPPAGWSLSGEGRSRRRRAPDWTLLDLVLQAGGHHVVAACPQICVQAVQNRFYGCRRALLPQWLGGSGGGGNRICIIDGVGEGQTVAAASVDVFVLDVMVHVFLLSVMTVLVSCRDLPSIGWLEFLVLMVFVFEKVACCERCSTRRDGQTGQ